MAESTEVSSPNIEADKLKKNEDAPDTDSSKDDSKSLPEVFPDISNVTEENLQLPYEKKLEMLTKDAETLYEFAIAKGLSSKQMQTCLTPFKACRKSVGRRVATDSSRSVLTLSCIVALCAIAWNVPILQKYITIHARLLSVKTIPLYDWTSLYNEDCIFYNPFLPPEKNLTEDDCGACLDLKEGGGKVDRLENVDLKTITDEYLYADFPFVVLDGLKNWPKDVNGDLAFSLDRVNELFEDHATLTQSADTCEFTSTMDDVQNITVFAKVMSKLDLPDKFHVSWENCDVSAAKVFRLLAPRPYFIPPFAEASSHNQIVVARGNFEDDTFDLPQQVDQATWFTTAQGEFRITLQPNEQCLKYKCKKKHTFILAEGDSVVVPSRIWKMSYTPSQDYYSMGYGSTLLWDDVM